MYGRNLIDVFEKLREIGMCSSERDFDTVLGARRSRYISNHKRLDGDARVSPAVVSRLRHTLDSFAARIAPGVAEDVRVVIRQIDRDAAVYAALAR